MINRPIVLSRRGLLRLFGAAPAALLLAACGGGPVSTTGPAIPISTATAAANASAPVAAATATASAPPTSTPLVATATTAPASTKAAAASATATTAAIPATPAAKPATTAPAQTLAPTPSCADGDDLTPAQTEGPYYTPNTPLRASLIEPSTTGTKMNLTGRVLTTSCRPVQRALIDFWQADDKGQYDNAGFKFRGHQFTDALGAWSLDTVVPGLYPGRTRHIHVKVQAPNQLVLTTQLYFPDESGNARDGIFHKALVMSVKDVGGVREATYDFVLNA